MRFHIRCFGLTALSLSAFFANAHAATSTPTPSAFNGPYNCNLTDRAQLIDRVSIDNWNASALVRQCDEICVLAYGTGNPDMSGVVVMVAFLAQASLTVLFGPLLCTFHFFQTPARRASPTPLFTSLKHIQVVVTEANAFLGISTEVAGIVRLQQRPPIFEISFLRILAGFLMLLTCLCALSQAALNIGQIPRVLTLACYVGVILTLTFTIILMSTKDPQNARDVYSQVTKECHRSRGYEDVSAWFRERTYLMMGGKTEFIVVIVALGIASIVGICAIYNWDRRGQNRRSEKPIPWYKPKIILTIMYVLTVMLVFGSWQAQKTRKALRAVSGPNYQDDQWGFGQVIAVLIPAPIVVTALHETYGMTTRSPTAILHPHDPNPPADSMLGERSRRADQEEEEDTGRLLPGSSRLRA